MFVLCVGCEIDGHKILNKSVGTLALAMGVPNLTTIDPVLLELSLQNHYAMVGDGLDVKAFYPLIV